MVGEDIEIEYEVRENTLNISYLYVKQNKMRQEIASEELGDIIEKYRDKVDFVRSSMSSNELSRKFLEDEGFVIENDNPSGLIEGFKRV